MRAPVALFPELGYLAEYPAEPNVLPRAEGKRNLTTLPADEKRAVWDEIQRSAPDFAEFLRGDGQKLMKTFGIKAVWFMWNGPRH